MGKDCARNGAVNLKSQNFIDFNKKMIAQTLEQYLQTKDQNFLELFSELVKKNNITSIDEFLGDPSQQTEELLASSTSMRSNIYRRLQDHIKNKDINGMLREVERVISQSKEKHFSEAKYSKEIVAQRSALLDSRLGSVYEYVGAKEELIGQHGLCIDLFPSKNKQGKKYNLYMRIFLLDSGKMTSWNIRTVKLIESDFEHYITTYLFQQ